ncbi:NAD(P)-binding protein [Acephala macrosclerotiorum]|nr:NAD(P)-binding protein [Acephala macrosclerotiorum]
MAAVIDTVKSTIAENFGEHQFDIQNDVPDLTSKVAIVTGGSEGIGYGCTHTLLANNVSKLFILSLSQEVVDGALDSISKELGPETARKVTFIKCDMGDWSRVAAVAKRIADATDRVDILISNAARGIMTYTLTEDGVDRHMAVNHMGHVILTSHLLPLMKKTAEKGNTVRIVTLGSNAHQATPSDCKFASLDELNQDLGPNGQYGRSKLAQMLYVRYLAKHLSSKHPKILANTVHPGFVDTKMSRDDIHEPCPLAGHAMSVGMAPFKKDQWMGATSALFCATKTEGSGEYICPPAVPEKGSSFFQNDELMESLMALTRQVVKEKTKSESVEKGCPFGFV